MSDLATHEFEAFDGASGRACTAMVMREGFGDQCGLPPEAHLRSEALELAKTFKELRDARAELERQVDEILNPAFDEAKAQGVGVLATRDSAGNILSAAPSILVPEGKCYLVQPPVTS